MTTPTRPKVDPAIFAGLSITPTDEPLPEPTRGAQAAGPNPFMDVVKASVDHDSAYSTHVPPEAISRAIFLINSAARKQNLGVRVVVNTVKDKDGKLVKGKDGKAQYVVEKSGPNAGKVLIRFQATTTRKGAKNARLFSIVKVKGTDDYVVRERATQRALFRGTHEEARQYYEELKARMKNDPSFAATVTAPTE